ncbi:hypothetical protein [Roseovarius sp. TE539]|uniref:hypothetical protein n=1 Tax=Roseovarius sp. TE539 TaxID=2249812 RepID=UPI0011BDA047|nr:hypothetical protein [Roseovarius sp. TE539]
MKLNVGYGTVSYARAVDEVPATTQVDGNVTIHNQGSPAKAAEYTVKHDFTAEDDDSGLFAHVFVTRTIPEEQSDESYHRVEIEAFSRVAESLRAIADELDRQHKESKSEK